MSDFEQFVPSKVCLSCDGCCRFKEADSSWRPKVVRTDLQKSRQEGLADKVLKGAMADDGRLITRCKQGEHFCTFFNALDHTCAVYTARPFECQLYPFLLNRQGSRIVLSVHLFCPYIQETQKTQIYQEYVEYLRGYFSQPQVLSALRSDVPAVDDYSAYAQELEDIFVIDGGNG